ncbi:PKD domain-containing protein [Pseudopedobacter sp.]|uniref:PKD domain-containing protein n=1 Tax=Pseudopedobacter sp. TaxID=1936787 RepID=UPI0033404A80
MATMSVFITAKSNSSGVVSCGTFTERFSVSADTVIEVTIPRDQAYLENEIPYEPNKGINIKVDAGQPKVVAYAHIFAGARSTATLVLPTEALGQKYYAISYTQNLVTQKIGDKDIMNVYSQFNIVAIEDDTRVLITPVHSNSKQATKVILLQKKGDVYSYQNSSDITGSVIEVDPSNPCKKIAVFSGSSALAIMPDACKQGGSVDPLFQQLYPIESWGKTFALIPFYNRLTGSIYRFLASEDNTTINYNGSTIQLAKAGDYYTTSASYSVGLLKSNNPIMVAQYALTQYCADPRNQIDPKNTNVIPSDPDMVILNPLEYSIDKITLYSSTKQLIAEQYINVTIPSVKVSSFRMNNTEMSGHFKAIPDNTAYSYAQIALHTIGGTNFSLSADTGFNAIAYGFGNVESYAYSAGTSLASTKVVNALKQGTNTVAREGCIYDGFDFKLVLPYEAQKITWLLESTDTEIVDENPVAKQIVLAGKTLYEYRLVANKVFTSTGVKRIQIKVLPKSSANVCIVAEEDYIDFDFEIVDLPVADFSTQDIACVGEEVSFQYIEKETDRKVVSWIWDFGDGETSSAVSPKHIFKQAGEYNVSLLLSNGVGCQSEIKTTKITVKDQKEPVWNTFSTLCTNVAVQFEDQTIYQSGDKVSWIWDFGDQNISNLQNPTYQFEKAGQYKVTLTLTNEYGCVNSLSKTLEIFDPANIDFENEKSCINDIVIFTAKALDGEVMSWEWDFGDQSNDITQKFKSVAQHQYNQPGSYVVTLKAISKSGCLSVLQKNIVISGENPKPSFNVVEPAICSGNKLQVINKSTNNQGEITKLEWFFDFGGNPALTLVDNNPSEGKAYEFRYPTLPQDKTYKIVLRAYSGLSCYKESTPVSIQVYGKPILSFNLEQQVCINSEPFKLDVENQSVTVSGQSKLAGDGISGDIFNPALAGMGKHELTYTFLSVNGCTDTLKRYIEVLGKPELIEQKEFNVLLGGEKQLDLELSATGSVSYQWFPSTGLSADNVLNPIARPTETTRYILTLSNQAGCINSYEITVNVHIDPYIPNAFRPNGDGINDTWGINYLETFIDADVRIFNRYGQEVFYSKRYTNAWDGKLNGQDVPMGVYYYIIEPNNGRQKYSGSLTLLR